MDCVTSAGHASFRLMWGGLICLTRSGVCWSRTFRRTWAEADVGRTTAPSSTAFSSATGPAYRGETYPRGSGSGRPFMIATGDGRRTAPGTGSCGPSRRADVRGRIDWSVVSVDSTVCRAHQHAAGAPNRPARIPGRRSRPVQHRSDEAVGRSRDGFSTKIHLTSDSGCLPLSILITPGQWGDALQLIPVVTRIRVPRRAGGHPRTRPDHLCGDKAYSSRRNRRYLRRRQIRHTIPVRRDQRANRQRRGSHGGRPAGFDRPRYARRNEVERTINKLKVFRAVATRAPAVTRRIVLRADSRWLGLRRGPSDTVGRMLSFLPDVRPGE